MSFLAKESLPFSLVLRAIWGYKVEATFAREPDPKKVSSSDAYIVSNDQSGCFFPTRRGLFPVVSPPN